MKTLLIYILPFFLTLKCFSQSEEIVVFKKRLNVQTIDDFERCDIYNNLAFEFQFRSLDSMKYYLDLSKKLAINNDYTKGKANLYYNLGIYNTLKFQPEKATKQFIVSLKHFKLLEDDKGISKVYNALGIVQAKQRNFTQAIEYFQFALELKKKLKNQQGIANINNSLALLHSNKGEHNKAISLYNEALKIYLNHGNKRKTADIHLNIGGTYYNIGNYSLSLEHFYKAKLIFEEFGDLLGIIKCLNNIGSIYRVQEKYNKAIENYKIVEKYYIKEKAYHKLANTYINLANVYRIHNRLDSSLIYYNKSIENSEKIDFQMGISTALYGMSNVLIDIKEYQKAIESLEKSLIIKSKLKDTKGEVHCYLNLSEVYLETLDVQKAINYGQRGLKIAQQDELTELVQRGHQLLSKAYQTQNKFKDALVHFQEYSALKDSLLNVENLQKLTALEYEYKYKKQITEAEKSLKSSEEKWHFGKIIFSFVIVLALFIILILIILNFRRKNQKLLLEQRLLRAQMNPHFMFNALGVLQGMILQKEYKTSLRYLGKFSQLLRSILENSRTKMVPLEQELNTIKTYVDLQNLGVEKPYNYTVQNINGIRENTVLIPSMLLQPFIENAIEHGFRRSDIEKNIHLSYKIEDTYVNFIIEDNGIGIEQTIKRNKRNKSLSTVISEERLELIYSKSKNKAKIQIEDLSNFNRNGTRVTLTLPYKENKI